MYVAVMDTESTSWIGLGETREEAEMAVVDRWNRYQNTLKENGVINKPWFVGHINSLDSEYGVRVTELKPGECKLDWED